MSAPMVVAGLLLVLGFALLFAGAPTWLIGLVAWVGACWAASWLDEPAERYEGLEWEGKG